MATITQIRINLNRFSHQKFTYSFTRQAERKIRLFMFSYSNMSFFNLAIKLNSWLFPRIAIRFNYYRKKGLSLTTILLTLTTTPGTDMGRLHLEASSTLTVKQLAYENHAKKKTIYTKIDFKASSILFHFLWNWDFNSLFRGLNASDLQYFYVLRSDDLNIQVPRASPLIKTD
jgi:hypothetical protein